MHRRGDRTGEIVLIADRPVDNRGGTRKQAAAPVPERPAAVWSHRVCEFCAAGYAGAAYSGADAAQLGEVADFRVGAPPGAQIVARTYF
jgi:hypothetical protein